MIRAARAVVVAMLLSLAPLAAEPPVFASQPSREPTIGAPSGLVIDAGSGDVLVAKSSRDRRPIASATKLMTALLALENADPGDVFTAPRYEALSVESQIGLREGERMKVRDLLAALLLESANDAAATIAANVSGSERKFVEAMNRRARELGLQDTRYANPIGFDDPDNFSSARDLAELARYLLRDELFAKTVDRPRAVLHSGSRRRVVENRNRLVVRYPEVDGVKTGHTAGAGYVLVGAATGRDAGVVSVVLGAPSEAARDSLSRTLLDFGMDQFRSKAVLRAGRPVTAAEVEHSSGDRATLTTPNDVSVTVRPGGGAIETRVKAPDEVEGPLPADSRVGSVDVIYGGEVVETAPLVTASAVAAPDALDRVRSTLGAPLTWVALAAMVLAATAAAGRIRAARRRSASG